MQAVAKKREWRRGPGRQPSLEGRVKFTTTLPAETVRRLREIGNGNASQAIIQLVRAASNQEVTRK